MAHAKIMYKYSKAKNQKGAKNGLKSFVTVSDMGTHDMGKDNDSPPEQKMTPPDMPQKSTNTE